MTKRPFTGVLRTPIDPREAKPRGLELVAGLPADQQDMVAYCRAEFQKRLSAFDDRYGLSSPTAHDIWERRAKALLNIEYKMASNHPNWWRGFFFILAEELVPGFSIKITPIKPGAPKEWTDLRFAELIADVEFLKRKERLSEGKICASIASKKGYGARWGLFRGKPAALRKALTLGRKRFDQKSFLKYFWAEVYAPGHTMDPIDLLIKKYAIKR